MNESEFLKVAKQAALEAGKIISHYSGKNLNKRVKFGDSSDFATQADIKAEEKIIDILTQNFPDHNIIAEEVGKLDRNSEYSWVIDPLDGTVSFVADVPTFGVSIGLLRENLPFLGVVNHVPFNDLYWAQQDKGAYLNGKRVLVTRVGKLEEAGVGLDFGHRKSRMKKVNRYVVPIAGKVSYVYCFGSAVTTQAFVGKGILDGYVAEGWIWDFVAGAVIVREAGGKVTDFRGQEPDWSKERLDIVASNGLIHDQILEALK